MPHKGWAEALDENAPARFEGLPYKAFDTAMQAQVRIGAIPLIRKAALGTDAHRRYAVKSDPTKRLAFSDRPTPRGVTAPSARLAGWCRDKRA
jgi:hypothetical protein